MKKVTAFVGSAHKRHTHQATVQFLNHLQALGEVEYEIVTLSNYKLGMCRGCRLCFDKGEAFCPLKDDRDVLFEKIAASDGVVFATPNYCFQMSGIMKVFLDRFGFAMHRPRYFGKAFTSIVSQGFGGGGKIIKDLDFAASLVGFNTVKGSIVSGFEPRTEKELKKNERALAEQSKRFYNLLMKPAGSSPSLMQVFIFRMGRTTVKQNADEKSVDYQYYADKGWLDSDYYYPTRLNPLHKAAGSFMDAVAGIARNIM
ncbi:MAG: flavodoxin family protein [Chloroflexi bacterium]|nr:MAG: flavodoxin family protein [Chloroflexota bacterium]